MNTYPNQSTVTVNKIVTENGFTVIERSEMFAAMRNLTESEFKLWLYLASNKNGYILALGPEAIGEVTGVSRTSYHDARKGLIKKGYLVKAGKKRFIFNTVSQSDGSRHFKVSEVEPESDESRPFKVSEVGTEIEKDNDYIENDIDNIRGINLHEDVSASGDDNIPPEREDGAGAPVDCMADIKPVYNLKSNRISDGTWTLKTPWKIREREREVRERDLIKYENWRDEQAYREVLELLVEYGYLSAKRERQYVFGSTYKYCKTKKNKIKHGVRVDGWNDETDEPMFTVAPYYVPPRMMRQRPGVCEEVRDRLKAKHSTPIATSGDVVSCSPTAGKDLPGSPAWWEKLKHTDKGIACTSTTTTYDDEDLPF